MERFLRVLLVCLFSYSIHGLKLPKPPVYVVTPSSENGRSAPFYYHNWMRRADVPEVISSTTTTTEAPKEETPDLIFAEFESGNGDKTQKSIRKLLEKEKTRIVSTTSTEPSFADENHEMNENLYLKVKSEPKKSINSGFYNPPPSPVYVPYSPSTTEAPTSTSTTTTESSPMSVENIWHIIDSEKYNNPNDGNWKEVSINDNDQGNNKTDNQQLTNNFALPGFSTYNENGAENESRAIRTDSNLKFPYVNLKTLQMKNTNSITGASKKGNNMFTSINNMQDVKNPIRGEAQDHVPFGPIDRYNPAQPYLPDYGVKVKQPQQASSPVKSVSNLIPKPPPPPPPPASDDSLFPPTNYESFPPYAPVNPQAVLPPQEAQKPSYEYKPPMISDSNSNDDGPQMTLGYKYKKPMVFVPTLPPMEDTLPGDYSYDKPSEDTQLDMPLKGYSYDKPQMINSPADSVPFKGYSYNKPSMNSGNFDMKPTYGGGHNYGGPSFDHEDPDYPELIFNKPNGGIKGVKDKPIDNDMGMVPPPPQEDSKPEDQGFPHEFPGDFKYHDFDDHDHFHHYHHHPTTTTTTTTTESPRVDRYSYYYLGKKLYYLPLYFSIYFIVYVGALIIKAVLRHKIVYPNSFRPNDQTSSFFSKRSVDSWDLSSEKLHEITGYVTKALGHAAEKYTSSKHS